MRISLVRSLSSFALAAALCAGCATTGTTGGTAAAVANAVYNATGIRVRQLPIRLEKLMA